MAPDIIKKIEYYLLATRKIKTLETKAVWKIYLK